MPDAPTVRPSAVGQDWPPARSRVAELFNRRAPTYDTSAMHRWLAHEAVKAVPLEPGWTVLDVGAGTGLAVREVAARVNAQGTFIALDLSRQLLKAGQRAAADRPKLHLVEGDACSLPFANESIDLIVCVAAIAYFANPQAALCEWRRVLRARGQTAFQVFEADTLVAPRLLREAAAANGLTLVDPNARVGGEAMCRQLLSTSGFETLAIRRAVWVERHAIDAQGTWNAIAGGVQSHVFERLSDDVREAIRADFFSRVAALGDTAEQQLPALFVHARRNP